ncbi:hypothetical protein [Agrobacterium tumefaciens]|uniref:Uncharacterized protein n=1 Tax=Agrobacterium tumefaciens TaxID=358 RepID=A0A176X194_AGRTU|nr:hypothetical protein [Agrobacterium tumefaciens]OAE40434.1 hypothetical protein A7J57_09095 [Agrobacterium tumefaciens]
MTQNALFFVFMHFARKTGAKGLPGRTRDLTDLLARMPVALKKLLLLPTFIGRKRLTGETVFDFTSCQLHLGGDPIQTFFFAPDFKLSHFLKQFVVGCNAKEFGKIGLVCHCKSRSYCG